MSSFARLMGTAGANATAASASADRLAEWDTDPKSRYLKSYRPKTLPPGISGETAAPIRPVPKNLLVKPKEGPSEDRVKAFLQKQFREKAKKMAAKMEEKKKAKERLLEARVKANEGKLTKKIVKQFSLSASDAQDKVPLAQRPHKHINTQRDPHEEARIALQKMRKGETRTAAEEEFFEAERHRRRQEDREKVRKEEEYRKWRREEKEREERRLAEKEGTKKSKPDVPTSSKSKFSAPLVEPDFAELMRIASKNEEVAAASGYTRTPSPPPIPKVLLKAKTIEKPGPASFKKKKGEEEIQAKVEAYRQELEAARRNLNPGLAIKEPPRPPSSTADRRPSSASSHSRSKSSLPSSSKGHSSGASSQSSKPHRSSDVRRSEEPRLPKPSSSSSRPPSEAPKRPKPGPACSKISAPKPASARPAVAARPPPEPSPRPPPPPTAPKNGMGQLSEAARERLARMNGRKPGATSSGRRAEAAPLSKPNGTYLSSSSRPSGGPSSSSSKPGGHYSSSSSRLPSSSSSKPGGRYSSSSSSAKPSGGPPSSSSYKRRLEEAPSSSSAAKRRPADDRARPPEPSFGVGKLRRPSPPPRLAAAQAMQARGKYAYSNVGGGARRPPGYDVEEEEEDSELDDFIDDTPLDDGGINDRDVQKTIQEVFKYDKRMFANEKWSRDDDRSMTASYKDIQKEERRSTIAGAKEDYEEFLREKRDKDRAKKQ